MPSAGSRDYFVRVLGPAEGFWVLVGFFDEAVDGSLQGDDGVEYAAFEPAVCQPPVARKNSAAPQPIGEPSGIRAGFGAW